MFHFSNFVLFIVINHYNSELNDIVELMHPFVVVDCIFFYQKCASNNRKKYFGVKILGVEQ